MLSSVNGSVHLEIKVELPAARINELGLLGCLIAQRHVLVQELVAAAVLQVQEQLAALAQRDPTQWVCTACGSVPAAGERGWVRRGMRTRQLRTAAGALRLPLLQATCLSCGKTRAAWAEAIGLGARQRCDASLLRAQVEMVQQLSYRAARSMSEATLGTSCSLATMHTQVQQVAACMELRVPQAQVLVIDGTKVPAGHRADQEELRFCYALTRQAGQTGRDSATLRLAGMGVGLGSWGQALPQGLRPEEVVTDAEPALVEAVRRRYPEARHQLCEWHIVHTLDWSLIEAGWTKRQRRAAQGKLRRILFGKGLTAAQRRQRYGAMCEQMPRGAKRQMERAEGSILFDVPSQARTTSLAERQMREVNRRVDVGARWSEAGVYALVLLRLARKHNPDDYERAWQRHARPAGSPASCASQRSHVN